MRSQGREPLVTMVKWFEPRRGDRFAVAVCSVAPPGLDLTAVLATEDSARDRPKLWRRALDRVSKGAMPPSDSEQPTPAHRAALVRWFAARAEPFRYPEAKHGKGELKYVNGVPVLRVEGTPAEVGEQLGVLALKPAAGLFNQAERF